MHRHRPGGHGTCLAGAWDLPRRKMDFTDAFVTAGDAPPGNLLPMASADRGKV